MLAKFPGGKIIKISKLIEDGQFDIVRIVRINGTPSHTDNSRGWLFKNSYYVNTQDGDKLVGDIRQDKKRCGC